jgi:CheY-like chemotaxis protein
MNKDKDKILIVDDEQNIRSLIKSIFSREYHVMEACNGEEAIVVARTQKPDLILMDIMMPNIDGYMACYTIKSDPELKKIPVIMLTGINHELNKKLGQRFGADGYLTKPFNLQELQDMIEKFLLISW